MVDAILKITDGTTEIDLLGPETGFHSVNWVPAIAQYKSGGVWRDSPYADGRRLVDKRFANTIETIQLKERDIDQDAAIYTMQEARRLFEKASSYWSSAYQNTPVYLIARASRETNTRYAIIHTASIPEDDYPYGPPFLQPGCAAVFDDLTLIIERGPWLANIPGTGTCVAITGSQDSAISWVLTFNGTTSRVQVTDNALIRNLPTGLFSQTMTVDGWINPDGWGENNAGRILDKTNSLPDGWWFGITSTGGLEARIYHGTQDAWSIGGLDDYVLDGLWHHVAFTWEVATGVIRLWIDGVEVSYATQDVAGGAYRVDTGYDLFIGNRSDNARTFDGDMGWIRITEGLRWAANFTAPTRCVMPFIDGPVPPLDTIAQWIGVEGSGATIDNQQGAVANDGTQTDCTFNDCDATFGRAVGTCLDEVYVANKDNQANITHIFTWSAANGFSANLMAAAFPYGLIDVAGAAPAVGDYVAFGINTALLDSGPFSSLVFDIGTVISGITVDDWEYSSAAGPVWTNLAAEQDNTNQDGVMTGSAFDTAGVGSVHWVPDSLWTAEALNGVTAYWIRAVVTAAPGAHVAPTQQNRDVYSIVWPYVTIDDAQVGGDIPALLQLNFRNRSDFDGSVSAAGVAGWANRVVVGSRSNSRGENFSPFINFAQEQNPAGIALALIGAGISFVADTTAPAGWHILVAAGAIAEDGFRIRFTQPVLSQYRGIYHAFVRGDITLGSATDERFRLSIRKPVPWSTDYYTFESTQDWSYIDFGRITFPPLYPSLLETEEMAYVDLMVQTESAIGAFAAKFYDLVLIPVDEWAGDFIDPTRIVSALGGSSTNPETEISGPATDAGPYTDIGRKFLNIDSVQYPRETLRAITETDEAYDYIWANYRSISPGPAILQTNRDQRLFFVSFRFDPTYDEWTSEPWLSHSLQLTKVQRYLSARGER